MPIEWVTSPPGPALDSIEAGLQKRSGAALIGPAGVGKSTLARAAVDRLRAAYTRVDWVTATAPMAAVPFAAFARLIDIPETGKTADVLRSARESLGDGRLLVIDDAHLLDPLSAALVYQLAVSAAATLILTVAPHGVMADGVPALWDDGLVERIELEPAGHDDRRLAVAVDEFIAGLPRDAHRVLEYFAVDDPLALDELEALAGGEAVDSALASGAVVDDDGWLRPAHPLFADAVREALGGPELRRLRGELVDRLAARPGHGAIDRLRRGVLALDSDSPQAPAEAAAAAGEALRLGDLVLSERLARAALGSAPELSTRLTLAYALAWQGRGRDADAALDEVDSAALSETELMAWALPRAANQFWMLSEPERATAFLRATRNRVSSPVARTTLDALSATFAMNAGSVSRAMRVAAEVLASPAADDTAVGWAAAAAALSSARTGRFADVDALAERAMAAGHPGLLRFTSGFGQTTALVMTGELDRAQRLARRLTDFAQLQQPGRAIGEVLVADVLIAKGELNEAARLLRGAAAALSPTGYSWGPLAWMLLTQALGQLGAGVEAGKALARAESRHGLKSMLFAPELALARAWTMSARRDGHGAVTAAREAVRSAERGGQTAVALRALLDAARLGDMRAVDAIGRISAQCDCATGRLVLAHGRALAARDGAALAEVSSSYAAAGWRGAAADAAAQSEAHR
ncbi:ATP-binding protein [Mycolicibacterium sp. ND9-15]|uniref:ATP-binding protein n=1 Tax=Mycolicibacterium sp. ND9-15 TaxID=3042320 RepID=UPI002DD99225|nr:ATP-binding protein [Mycolicibacterium sp. ND9-15]WSE55355.1 ATP-binding protein [Mycolicibacterium sp. ND9-15]